MKFRKILSGFIATALSLSVLPGSVLAASGSMTIDVNSVVKDTVDIGVSTDYSITNPVYVDGEVNPDFIRSFNSFKMPLVRIGEGAMSVFEWKDSIGAIENRAEQTLWNVTGKVEAGPLEIVKAYEEINPDVEFTVTLNMLTDTAEDAADFVEFLTGDVSTEWGAKRAEFGHPEPVNVSVFELGNELDRQDMSITEYIAASKEFISAIEAVKPDAKFAAHANTGIYNAVRDNKSGYFDWHNAILADEILSNKIDYLSLHTYYSYSSNGLMDKIINIIEEDIKDAGKEDEIKIYISEIAGYYLADDSTNPNPHNLRGVIETANIYSRMMKQDAVEKITYHGLDSSEWKHVVYKNIEEQKEMYLNGIGQLSKMFTEYAQGEVLSASLTGFNEGITSSVSGIAVKDDEGNINLIFTNKESSSLTVDVNILGDGDYVIKRDTQILSRGSDGLDADMNSTQSNITVDTYDYATKTQISTYTVPAYSVCAVELEKAEEKKLNVIKSYDFSDMSEVSDVTGDATLAIVNGKLSVTSFEDFSTYSENNFHLTTENTNAAFNLKADINISDVADPEASALAILLNTDSDYANDNQVNIPLEVGQKTIEISVAENGVISAYINGTEIETDAGTLKNASGYIGVYVSDVNFTLDNVVISEFENTVEVKKMFTYEENFDGIENGRLPEGWDIMSSSVSAGVEDGKLIVNTRDWDNVKGIKFTNLGEVQREGLTMEADVRLIEHYGRDATRPKTGFLYMMDGTEKSTGGLYTFFRSSEFSEVGSADLPTASTEAVYNNDEGFLAGEKVTLKLVFASKTQSPDVYVNGTKLPYANIVKTQKNSGFLGLMVRACKIEFDNIKISGIQTSKYLESEVEEKIVDFTYEENFNTVADGTLPVGWSIPDSSEFAAQVSGGKLVIDCAAWKTKGVLIESLGEVLREGLTMEADVQLVSYDTWGQSNAGQRPQAGFAYMYNETGMSSAGLLAWWPQGEFREQGVSGFATASTAPVYGKEQGFIAKETVKMKIAFNNATQSPELYINDTLCADYYDPILNTTNNSGLVGLMAYAAKAEFDNVRITGKHRVSVPKNESTVDAFFKTASQEYENEEAAIEDVKVTETDALGNVTDITENAEISTVVEDGVCTITVTYKNIVVKVLTCKLAAKMIEKLVDFTYEENFDNVANGTLPEGWTIPDTREITAQVSNGKFVLDVAAWSRRGVLIESLGEVLREGLTMEADVTLVSYDAWGQSNAGQRPQSGFAYMADDAGMSSAGLLAWWPQCEFREQGVTNYTTASTEAAYGKEQGFIAKETVKMKIAFNNATQTPEVYINGKLCSDWYTPITNTTVNSGLVGLMGYASKAEFDNLKITGKHTVLVPDTYEYDAFFKTAGQEYDSEEAAIADVKVTETDALGIATDITESAEISAVVEDGTCTITVTYKNNVVKVLTCKIVAKMIEKVVDFTYEENFDNIANGTLPEGWIIPDTREITAQVSNGKFVIDVTAWSRRSVLIESLGEVLREGLTMEADVTLVSYDAGAQSSYGQRPQAGFAYMADDAGMSSAGLLAWWPQCEFREYGVTNYTTASTDAAYGKGQGFIAKETVKMKIAFNNATQTPEVYINDKLCNDWYTPITNTTVNSGLVGLMTYTAKAEFDNIKITGKHKVLVADVVEYDAFFKSATMEFESEEAAIADVKVTETDALGNVTDITESAEISAVVDGENCVITVIYEGEEIKTLNCKIAQFVSESFIYEENFDNIANGTLPEGWTIPDTREITAQVTDGKLVIDTTAWSRRSVLIECLGEVLREGLTMEADVTLVSYDAGAQSSYGQRPQAGFTYMYTDAGMSSAGLLAWWPQGEFREQGVANYTTASTEAAYGKGQGFIAKETVKMKIAFNNATQSPDLYINGKLCNDWYTPITNTTNNSGYIGLMTYTAKAEFDNIKITGKRVKIANKENSIIVNDVNAINGSPVISAEVKCADSEITNAWFVAAVYDKATNALVDVKIKSFDAQTYKWVKTDFVIDSITDYSSDKYDIKIMAMDMLTLKPISGARSL